MMIERADWIEEAAAALAPALLEDAPEIARQVATGVCELWRLHSPGDGWVVTRLEVYESIPAEFVLVAGAGRGYVDALPGLVDLARANGAGLVRVHTHRPGVCRWLERAGFAEAERVYVKKVE